MDQKYLLHYYCNDGCNTDYAWFETGEALKSFIDTKSASDIYEVLKIDICEDLTDKYKNKEDIREEKCDRCGHYFNEDDLNQYDVYEDETEIRLYCDECYYN